MTKNVYWHTHKVKSSDRSDIKGHKSCLLWFTGLPSSGKSTIANDVDFLLNKQNVHTYVLDGDNVRHGLNKDLGFLPEEREENIRRIGEVANLFVDAGLIVLTAFISPYRRDRNRARDLMGEGKFIEVFVKCPVDECEKRDVKGLFKKARAGEIKQFTGIDAPYEEPESAEIVIETDKMTQEQSAQMVIDYLKDNGYIS